MRERAKVRAYVSEDDRRRGDGRRIILSTGRGDSRITIEEASGIILELREAIEEIRAEERERLALVRFFNGRS